MTSELTGTQVVHAAARAGRDLSPALHQSSVYAAHGVADAVGLEEMTAGISSYTRVANPTVQQFERAVSELEGADGALATPSGMAALTLVFLTLLSAQDRVVASPHSYADTISVLRELSARVGFEVCVLDLSAPDRSQQLDRIRPTMIVLESPSNPMVRVADIDELSRQLHAMDAILVVDSTLGTPVNQRPLRCGADIVVHSATKYLSGHYNVVAGVIATDADTIRRLHHMRTITGNCLDPHAAWLLLQGLQTLHVRVHAQNRTAGEVAAFLAGHPAVEFVAYPGLDSDPGHQVARRQMAGYGGVLSFGPRFDQQQIVLFLESLTLCTLTVSLGGTKTLIESPALMSHAQGGPDNESLGVIPANTLRLSVGLEDARDIIDDLAAGLAKASGTAAG